MNIDDLSENLVPELVDEGVLTAADLEEEPSIGGQPPQLYDPDDPLGLDTEATMVAEMGDGDAGAVSAEEAAMRIEDDPGGLNYDEDPGYLE